MNIKIYAWTNKPDPSMEKVILSCCWENYRAEKSVEYARKILKNRWLKAEKYILKSPYYSYLYARHVIKDKWEKAEKIIAKDCRSSYLYAKYVLKNRFILGEKNKSSDSFRSNRFGVEEYIYYYSKYVLKTRWHDREKILQNASNNHWKVLYTINIRKSKWENIEDAILESPYIEDYVKVLKEEEKEQFMNKILSYSLIEPKWKYQKNYAKEYIIKNK